MPIKAPYDLERDLRTLEEMAARLVPYVYENELFGAMPGDLPTLTVGGLLMRLHRLAALSERLSAHQKEVLHVAQEKADLLRHDWPVAYHGKIQREFQSRVTTISRFIDDSRDNPRSFRESYSPTAEQRLMLEMLYDEATAREILTDAMKGALPTVDNSIRRFTDPGEFIWDAQLEPVYPKEKFWFLHIK